MRRPRSVEDLNSVDCRPFTTAALALAITALLLALVYVLVPASQARTRYYWSPGVPAGHVDRILVPMLLTAGAPAHMEITLPCRPNGSYLSTATDDFVALNGFDDGAIGTVVVSNPPTALIVQVVDD